MTAPLFGLVLAGGASTRMQQDKAALAYHGKPQLNWAYDLLADLCAATFISVRPDQRDEPTRAGLPQIVDAQPGIGPIAGISAALTQHPKVAWLVVACDLPFLTTDTLKHLIAHRDVNRVATVYRSANDALPEPLCAIWEPAAREGVLAHIASGKQCPRKFLINANVHLLDLPDTRALDNVNTANEYQTAIGALGANSAPSRHETPLNQASSSRSAVHKTVLVQYYAVLREQAGRNEESLETQAITAGELYGELQARHPFHLAPDQLKVAINDEFAAWDTQLASGDTIVFIPPVAGG